MKKQQVTQLGNKYMFNTKKKLTDIINSNNVKITKELDSLRNGVLNTVTDVRNSIEDARHELIDMIFTVATALKLSPEKFLKSHSPDLLVKYAVDIKDLVDKELAKSIKGTAKKEEKKPTPVKKTTAQKKKTVKGK